MRERVVPEPLPKAKPVVVKLVVLTFAVSMEVAAEILVDDTFAVSMEVLKEPRVEEMFPVDT